MAWRKGLRRAVRFGEVVPGVADGVESLAVELGPAGDGDGGLDVSRRQGGGSNGGETAVTGWFGRWLCAAGEGVSAGQGDAAGVCTAGDDWLAGAAGRLPRCGSCCARTSGRVRFSSSPTEGATGCGCPTGMAGGLWLMTSRGPWRGVIVTRFDDVE